MPDAPSSPVPAAPEADDDEDHKAESSDDDEEEEKKGGNEEAEADGDDDTAPEQEPEAEDTEASVKEPTPPTVPMVRRKRLGRPPKNRPPDWDNMISVPASEVDNTPRRRGRGGWRGRGGRKPGVGQAPLKLRQAIDKEGTEADIVDDECVLPEDPEGETKVDRNGSLQGDREYRCRTFTVLGRESRLYMLSTEPARCVGFRDSYLFFTKHLKLHKIIVDDEEKRDMIDRDIIPHSYKGRSIGIVTARSVFREFGARIVVGGRRVRDDYRVADAIAEGAVAGELADPNDVFNPAEPYNKNQYVAWHGASAVYHQAPAAAPDVLSGKPELKKRKVNVNNVNWMLEHARDAG
jgi:chromatin structure-remodeling complex protein RSC7